jgi:hypothetical protein
LRLGQGRSLIRRFGNRSESLSSDHALDGLARIVRWIPCQRNRSPAEADGFEFDPQCFWRDRQVTACSPAGGRHRGALGSRPRRSRVGGPAPTLLESKFFEGFDPRQPPSVLAGIVGSQELGPLVNGWYRRDPEVLRLVREALRESCSQARFSCCIAASWRTWPMPASGEKSNPGSNTELEDTPGCRASRFE